MAKTEDFNATIYERVVRLERVEEETGRAAWREYMKQITPEHAKDIQLVLHLQDLTQRLDVAFVDAGGSEDGGLEFGLGASPMFAMFMSKVLELFKVPAPKHGELVWQLLFRQFSTASRPSEAGQEESAMGPKKSQKRVLSKQECKLMVHTMAHVILKAHNLQVLQIAMTGWVKAILASPSWKQEFEKMQSQGITGVQHVLSKKEKVLADVEWRRVFETADVGRSGLLSWRTKQFHVFVREVIAFVEFPEPEGEEVSWNMFEAFASEGSDVITENECKTMVGAVMDAAAFAMQA